MLTRVDLEDLMLEAQARADGWADEFYQSFYQPELTAQMVMELLASPPEVREALRRSDPKQYERLTVHVKRLQKMAGGSYGPYPT